VVPAPSGMPFRGPQRLATANQNTVWLKIPPKKGIIKVGRQMGRHFWSLDDELKVCKADK